MVTLGCIPENKIIKQHYIKLIKAVHIEIECIGKTALSMPTFTRRVRGKKIVIIRIS